MHFIGPHPHILLPKKEPLNVFSQFLMSNMCVLLLLDFFSARFYFKLVSLGDGGLGSSLSQPLYHTSFGWKQSSVFALHSLCKHYLGQKHIADIAYFFFPATSFSFFFSLLELAIVIFMTAYKLITESTSHSASYLSLLSQSPGQYTPLIFLALSCQGICWLQSELLAVRAAEILGSPPCSSLLF